MSTVKSFRNSRNFWWRQLGLLANWESEVEDVLSMYLPVQFRALGGNREQLTFENVVKLVEKAQEQALERSRAESAEREIADDEEFAASFDSDNADMLIEQGRWAGFRQGEARAWSFNLFQYEPTGFVHPGSQVRIQALKKLRSGDIPEVFGYPERARELSDSGMTPQQYRTYRKALGAKTFSSRDVRRLGILRKT